MKSSLLGVAYLTLGVITGAHADEPQLPLTVVAGAKLTVVYEAPGDSFEGPTWDPKSAALYFTAYNKQQILRLDHAGKVTVWLDKSQGINGTFLSIKGRLLGAQVHGHRVMSFGLGDSKPTDIITLFEDPHLHQPNDLCQTACGDIYFSDPDFRGKKSSAVYHLSTAGKATKVIEDMPLPNGVIASLDGKILYVSDGWLMHWRSYPIQKDGSLGPGQIFFNPPTANRSPPDGMTIDQEGNLYFAGRGGVWCVSPAGKTLGFIGVPVFCSNLTLGGADGKTLYLTGSGKVFSLAMQVRGGR